LLQAVDLVELVMAAAVALEDYLNLQMYLYQTSRHLM
jgi:hypothetical protein